MRPDREGVARLVADEQPALVDAQAPRLAPAGEGVQGIGVALGAGKGEDRFEVAFGVAQALISLRDRPPGSARTPTVSTVSEVSTASAGFAVESRTGSAVSAGSVVSA